MEKEIVNKYIAELNRMADKALECGNIDKVCAALQASARIQYEFNQEYTDDICENYIEKLVSIYKMNLASYVADENLIIFYDSFGLDTRGLALIYLKALCDLNFHVVYIVPKHARNKQPEIVRQTAGGNIDFCYLKYSFGHKKILDILKIISYYKPQHAFFYTTPFDVEACVTFACMDGMTKRYQINLTDHAFWLGRNAFDYCLEFREYGACISWQYRKINKNKLCMLPYYPYVNTSLPFAGFPFKTDEKKILFSGGSLYKTIDKEGTYYNIVANLLKRHNDLIFIYAGSGDTTRLKKLQDKFPNRAFHIAERKDLFALMQHCTIYMNTYPVIGGLMSQYAAAAGKIPITLVPGLDNSLDGLLLNHHNLNAEFDKVDDMIAEMDKLLDDSEYREREEQKLYHSVMKESEFRESIMQLLEEGKTKFSFRLHEIETKEFRSHYVDRFTYDKLACCLINKDSVILWKSFPKLFFYRLTNKIKDIINNS